VDTNVNNRISDGLLKLAREGLNAIFPNQCAFCGQVCRQEPDFPRICRNCLAKIPFRKQQEMELTWQDEPCAGNMTATKVFCATWYLDPVRPAVLRMKFADAPEIADALAAVLLQCWRKTGLDCLAVIAVPLHKSRLRERGYNQAGLLAERVARELDRPDWSQGLLRTKMTARQSSLSDPMSRKINMADAFQLDPDFIFQLNALQQQKTTAPVLLIDDVLTTGVTLAEAAQPLRSSGLTVSGLVVSSAHPASTTQKRICGY